MFGDSFINKSCDFTLYYGNILYMSETLIGCWDTERSGCNVIPNTSKCRLSFLSNRSYDDIRTGRNN